MEIGNDKVNLIPEIKEEEDLSIKKVEEIEEDIEDEEYGVEEPKERQIFVDFEKAKPTHKKNINVIKNKKVPVKQEVVKQEVVKQEKVKKTKPKKKLSKKQQAHIDRLRELNRQKRLKKNEEERLKKVSTYKEQVRNPTNLKREIKKADQQKNNSGDLFENMDRMLGLMQKYNLLSRHQQKPPQEPPKLYRQNAHAQNAQKTQLRRRKPVIQQQEKVRPTTYNILNDMRNNNPYNGNWSF